MTFDPQTTTSLYSLFANTVLFLLCAKIWRELGAEQLRERLDELDAELFEQVRRGRIHPTTKACSLLRQSILHFSDRSGAISLTRFAIARLRRRAQDAQAVERRHAEWEVALRHVKGAETREALEIIRTRVLMAVAKSVVLGPVAGFSGSTISNGLALAWSHSRAALVQHARVAEASVGYRREASLTA